jgi:hypothetical protein
MPETQPSGDNGPRVEIAEAVYETHGSAAALAKAFGSSVFEPLWWPNDAGEISYTLDRFPSHANYRIGSIRAGGVPIAVIGFIELESSARSPRDWMAGEWHEPSELSHVNGLIGRVGIPRRLQAFVWDGDTRVTLIGFDSEADIIRAVRSFVRASPG